MTTSRVPLVAGFVEANLGLGNESDSKAGLGDGFGTPGVNGLFIDVLT